MIIFVAAVLASASASPASGGSTLQPPQFSGSTAWVTSALGWKYDNTASFTIKNSPSRTSSSVSIKTSTVVKGFEDDVPYRIDCTFVGGDKWWYEGVGGAFVRVAGCEHPMLFEEIDRSNYADLIIYKVDPSSGVSLVGEWSSRGGIELQWRYKGAKLSEIIMTRMVAEDGVTQKTTVAYGWDATKNDWIRSRRITDRKSKILKTNDWGRISVAPFAFR